MGGGTEDQKQALLVSFRDRKIIKMQIRAFQVAKTCLRWLYPRNCSTFVVNKRTI